MFRSARGGELPDAAGGRTPKAASTVTWWPVRPRRGPARAWLWMAALILSVAVGGCGGCGGCGKEEPKPAPQRPAQPYRPPNAAPPANPAVDGAYHVKIAAEYQTDPQQRSAQAVTSSQPLLRVDRGSGGWRASLGGATWSGADIAGLDLSCPVQALGAEFARLPHFETIANSTLSVSLADGQLQAQIAPFPHYDPGRTTTTNRDAQPSDMPYQQRQGFVSGTVEESTTIGRVPGFSKLEVELVRSEELGSGEEGETEPGEGGVPGAPGEAEAEEPEVPPLPEDVSKWTKDDYYRAKEEADPRLVDAVEHLGKRFAGTDAAGAAANLLANILRKEEPPEEEATEGQGTGRIPYRPRPVYRVGRGQQGSLVETAVNALGANGSPEARQTLLELMAGTFPTEDDGQATEAAVETLAGHPGPENEALLLRALLESATLRPAGRGDVSAEELRQEAFEAVQPTASEELRVKLAGHILKPTTPQTEREQFGQFLMEQDPRNVPAQMVLYTAPGTNQERKAAIEQFFTESSSGSLRRLLDLASAEKVDELSGGRRPGYAPPPTYPRAGGRYRPYGMGRPQEEQKPDPDLPYRIARELWQPQFTDAVRARLDGLKSLEKETDLLRLATTVPTDTVRATLAEVLEDSWEDGPGPLESAGVPEQLLSDPGFLTLIKMLPRRDPKDVSARRPTAGPRYGTTQKPDRLQTEEAWMAACEAMVRQWCRRLRATSQTRSEAARTSGKPSRVGETVGQLPFKLHDDAAVVDDYRFVWPDDLPGEKLSGVPLDPMTIHYVRVEETGKPMARLHYYRRILRSTEEHRLEDGVWLESFRTEPGSDRKRSIDVLITVEKPEKPDKDEPPDPNAEMNYVLEVLFLDVRDPKAGNEAT